MTELKLYTQANRNKTSSTFQRTTKSLKAYKMLCYCKIDLSKIAFTANTAQKLNNKNWLHLRHPSYILFRIHMQAPL